MVRRTLSVSVVLLVFLSPAPAAASSRATAGASATPRGLVVGDSRFFPVMLIDQCTAADIAHGRTLGINLIVNESCPGLSATAQLGLLHGNGLEVLPIAARGASGIALAGFTYPDEPDNNGWTPASLRKAAPSRRGNADGLVRFLTTTGGFFRQAPYRHPQVPLSAYAGFVRQADMAGFDLYPLGACRSDLSSVYDAQRAFVALAGRTPTFQWIETGPIRPGYCGGFTMSAAELSAEVWLAVIGGARGIGYFTHTWSPAHSSFDVTADVQKAMRHTDTLLAAAKPGLLGQMVASQANSSVVELLARHAVDGTYAFAVDSARLPITAQLRVPQLHDGPVRVLGEHRSLDVHEHSLVDHFDPLQVHVYVQAP